MIADRCAAAHSDDPTPCEGPQDAVRILDQHGSETLACVHHGARLYASLTRPRVYSGSVEGAAIEVYDRAQATRPFPWQAVRRRPMPSAYGPTSVSNNEGQPLRAVVHVAYAMSRDELLATLAYDFTVHRVDPLPDGDALTVSQVRQRVEEWLAASNCLELDEATRSVREGRDGWEPEQRAAVDALGRAVDRAYPPEVTA